MVVRCRDHFVLGLTLTSVVISSSRTSIENTIFLLPFIFNLIASNNIEIFIYRWTMLSESFIAFAFYIVEGLKQRRILKSMGVHIWEETAAQREFYVI